MKIIWCGSPSRVFFYCYLNLNIGALIRSRPLIHTAELGARLVRYSVNPAITRNSQLRSLEKSVRWSLLQVLSNAALSDLHSDAMRWLDAMGYLCFSNWTNWKGEIMKSRITNHYFFFFFALF